MTGSTFGAFVIIAIMFYVVLKVLIVLLAIVFYFFGCYDIASKIRKSQKYSDMVLIAIVTAPVFTFIAGYITIFFLDAFDGESHSYVFLDFVLYGLPWAVFFGMAFINSKRIVVRRKKGKQIKITNEQYN